MADITAALVKQLRDATSVSMMECKKALVETGVAELVVLLLFLRVGKHGVGFGNFLEALFRLFVECGGQSFFDHNPLFIVRHSGRQGLSVGLFGSAVLCKLVSSLPEQ